MTHRKSAPSLRRHKPSQRGVVTLNGHDHYLGHWPNGKRKPPAAVQSAYDSLIAEWLVGGRQSTSSPLSVSGLILKFWEEHATLHYRHLDGSPTSELANYKLSLRPLRELYGLTPAAKFSPLKLKAVRKKMIAADLSRGVINQRIGRIRRMFLWAVGEELVTESVHSALMAVDGLQAGRSAARDTKPIKPVSDTDVEAVLPFLTTPLRGLVQVQRITGMRPGEAAIMRWCDIDKTGEIWSYRPARHKLTWQGIERIIALGPRCQEVLLKFAKADANAYLFSPREGREEWFASKRATRKSKVQPSQVCRRKAKPRRKPGAFYTRHAYAAAISRACEKAKVPHWHPNQIRHTSATEIRRNFGLEAAQVTLGHAKASTTEIYAERDQGLAERVAQKAG